MASVQRKGNKWYFVFYDNKTKKRNWILSDVDADSTSTKSLERSKKRAEKALTMYEEGLKTSPSLVNGKILFSDFSLQWLEHQRVSIRIITYDGYKKI